MIFALFLHPPSTDEFQAFGVAAGWNFFIFEAALVPFEIVACNVIITFWSSAVPVGAIIAIVIFLYG